MALAAHGGKAQLPQFGHRERIRGIGMQQPQAHGAADAHPAFVFQRDVRLQHAAAVEHGRHRRGHVQVDNVPRRHAGGLLPQQHRVGRKGGGDIEIARVGGRDPHGRARGGFGFRAPGGRGGEAVAHCEQVQRHAALDRAVQQNGQPGILVHVVGGQDARVQAQRTGQGGVALDVEDIGRARPRQPQAGARHRHEHGVPPAAVGMAQHGVGRCILPKIFRLCAEGFGRRAQNFRAGGGRSVLHRAHLAVFSGANQHATSKCSVCGKRSTGWKARAR